MSLLRNSLRLSRATKHTSLYFSRYQSTLIPELQQLSKALKDQNNIGNYQEILTKLSQSKHDSETIDQNLTILDEVFEKVVKDDALSKDSKEYLHNYVLANFIKHDPSLSTIHQRHLKKIEGSLTIDSLIEIIKHNSGRVNSSWEIFEIYYNTLDLSNAETRDRLLRAVIEKLIKGDSSDHEEDLFKISQDSLIKSIILAKNLKSIDASLSKELLKLALEYENFQIVKNLTNRDDLYSVLETLNEDKLAKVFSVLELDQITTQEIENNIHVFEKLVNGLSNPQFSLSAINDNEINEIISRLSERFQSSLPGLVFDIQEQETKGLTKDGLLDQILLKIETQLNSSDPRYEPLKSAALKSQVLNNQILENSPETSKSTPKLDLSVSSQISLLAYQFVQTGDEQFLDKAFYLFSADSSNVKSLQALILASSFKDPKISLELYNKTIKLASKENNELGVSDAGLLTESLLLAFLSHQDREFAYLVHDGAVINNVVEGDTQLARLKAIFKRYGEIVGEEEESIKPLLKQEVNEAIMSLF